MEVKVEQFLQIIGKQQVEIHMLQQQIAELQKQLPKPEGQ